VNLVGDVLDKQVTDREREPLGKVDGIIIVLRRGQAPRVAWLELGLATAARRVHPRIAAWIERIERKLLGAADSKPTRLAFDRIKSVGIEVHVDVDGRRTTALVWERWWRQVFSHIPGHGSADQHKTTEK
jgi:hypothetical protein